MKRKNVIIIAIIIIILLIGGGAYFFSRFFGIDIDNSGALPKYTKELEINNTTTPNDKIDFVEGTMKSLLARGKTEECTYSYNTDNATITGQVYTSNNGKIRHEFQSTSVEGPVNGHMIVDSGDAYMWTDEMGQGFKFSIANQPAADGQNNKTPDINKSMQFECLPWNVDNSMFVLPTNITFQTMSAPVKPSAGQTGGPNNTNLTNQCVVCDNIPEGSAREACKTQLKCQ